MSENQKRWTRFFVQVAAITMLICLDRLFKALVEARLKGRGTVVLLRGVLGLTYAENTGAAFSMFSNSTAALTVVAGVALFAGLLALALVRKKALIYDICIPLIIAGGAGNQIDRVTRGYVIDYIRTLFIDFPVFNFADCLITCSCFAIAIWLVYEIVRDSKKEKEARGGSPA